MTLIELLVALTLIALLSVGLIETFRLSQRLYVQITRHSTEVSEILTTHRVLRRLIGAAYPPDLLRPIDDANRFGISYRNGALEITAPQVNGTSAAMHHYRVTTQARGSTYDVIVRDEAATSRSSVGEILLSRVASVTWTFLPHGDGQHGDTWQSAWADSAVLPALVQLQVTFPPGDRRRWPQLIVDSRIDANARCEFDVIARTCRRRGT
jgi:general secretion pathway protein J